MAWCASAFAADGVDGIDSRAAVEAAVQDLVNSGIPEVEARAIAGQAAAEVAGGKELAESQPQTGREGAGTTGTGGSYTGGQTTSGGELTDQEKALMGEVNARTQELQKQGMGEGAIRETIEAEMGDKLRDVAEQQGRTSEGFREQMEGHSLERLNELYREEKLVGEALERGSSERPTEGSSRETPETHREAPEAPAREVEQREAPEAPAREVEQREAPESAPREVEQPEAPTRDPIEGSGAGGGGGAPQG
ncbi:MAG: hypothetical protein HYZ95_02380 [Candidatus Omnitrophica bacterium]|nr:hypothetical protein [Candidatus Omnitrophota bacterium]